MHISVNHSASEWVRVNATLTTMRMRHHFPDLGSQFTEAYARIT